MRGEKQRVEYEVKGLQSIIFQLEEELVSLQQSVMDSEALTYTEILQIKKRSKSISKDLGFKRRALDRRSQLLLTFEYGKT